MDMRVLVLTKIFPNGLEPLAAPFNRQQVAALAERCDVEVVAPVPWFPGARLFGRRLRAGRLATLPPRGEVGGISTYHPKGLYLPLVGIKVAVPLLSWSLASFARSHRGRCDVVLGTWLYPDACAAIHLAEALGVPAVVKAHGSDANGLGRRPDVRRVLGRFLPRAAAALAPSRALSAKLRDLGAPAAHTHHVPNGVDRETFQPRDRAAARRALGLPEEGPTIVYVGRLDRRKGVGELLSAHEQLGEVRLVVVGDGPLRAELASRARRSEGKIIAVGARPLVEVAMFFAAADVVTLPSYAEGSPNSVLEALACGRPVVASSVGGIPEVVIPGRSGLLVPPRDVPALAGALRAALHRDWDAQEIARLGPCSWRDSADLVLSILTEAVGRARTAA
jgi:teichuronic acid biosynthesis glycosyltransferase TuaC